MFKIIGSENAVIAYVDEPFYIKQSENGSYYPCSYEEATGVSLKDTVYHLLERDELEGSVDDVIVEKVDGGEVVFTNETNVSDLTDQLITLQEMAVEQALNGDLEGLEGLEGLDL